ncbi:MAG: 30S ribosomal protein S12 methylthiotransferase RimO [Caldilineaceae bacterium SB0675_bin_29]|uniref:Ribosomal protein uS12 methylthiotransferase RimO n=1 Tax=Caldilineaceae bacterium SB0675_bin_29 TaxID=2605266 RepID=A0A6B1FXZ5_9CHLR|nr:30S ribosomal protein S12 methylthiotransferase RimO [Caldilineaceae bacterium SB0675_bin_29]
MNNRQTYHLVTLGCPKNEVDSDGMEMLLRQADFGFSTDVNQADVLIVNTCGFLEAAKEESIRVLQELADGKRRHQMLIAAGCLAQRNGEEVLARVPEVDGLLGTRRWMDVVELIRRVRGGPEQRRLQRYSLLGEPDESYVQAVPRPPVAGGSAYLKISDGCNAPCAFCTIPSFKGKLRSRPMEAIIDEANALVAAGAKELVIVAQDTTDFGRDQGAPDSLPRLLSALCNRTSDALKWVRLMYAYPGHVSDGLIEVMASQEKIVPYLDMPLQHGDPRTLRRMRRPSRLEMVYDHVEKLRAAMPDIAMRTTFLVGYPGETEEEFQGLLEFVQEIEFDKVGAFPFSPEPGTPAAELPDPVAEEEKEERYGRLMEAQQPISLRKNQEQVGKVLDILVEGQGEIAESGAPLVMGRSYRDAPEVDGLVLVPGIAEAPAGAILQVHINGALEYDLVGEPLLAETFSSRTEMLAELE